MAWNFRYYEKKRGHRRTGSRTVGSLGEAIFFAILFVLGCAGIVAGILLLVIPEWRVNHEFIEDTCVVSHRKIGEKADETTLFRPEITIDYRVHGTWYSRNTYDIHRAYSSDREAAQAALDQFDEGKEYTCWYDPANPEVVVLVRGYQWWIWIVFLVPASFLAIGIGGLVYTFLHWGRSAERRAAVTQRAQSHELFEIPAAARPKFPTVPDWSDITSSPGTRLAYRLPLVQSPAWILFGLLTAGLLWNGVVTYWTFSAIAGHLRGEPDWLLTLFILPFLAIGIVLAACFVRQLLIAHARLDHQPDRQGHGARLRRSERLGRRTRRLGFASGGRDPLLRASSQGGAVVASLGVFPAALLLDDVAAMARTPQRNLSVAPIRR